ncbi:hypothetical protein EDB83DRAFT_2551253 [Lactarius deliciosus]|nr:hypothetical protein EDB83DRAFT_2551253 [Lactarius deliciosus]
MMGAAWGADWQWRLASQKLRHRPPSSMVSNTTDLFTSHVMVHLRLEHYSRLDSNFTEHFYKALFSTSRREQEIPYHERSAKALRFAVKKLRRIALERWVNFVHYGA